MSRMTFSPTTSRRDLARLRHRSRPHNVARLRHRLLQAERLEDRRLLAYADFELSSLLPANGGDGSTGFVVSGITNGGKLGYPISNSQPLADVNQDGIDDFLLSAPGTNGGTAAEPGVCDLRASGRRVPRRVGSDNARRHKRLRD